MAGVTQSVVRRRLRERAAAIEREQRERALAELEGQDGLTPEQRRVVESMAADIVCEVLTEADAALTDHRADDVTARAVARLFELDGADPG